MKFSSSVRSLETESRSALPAIALLQPQRSGAALRPPSKREPGDIAKLDGPGDGVGGDGELVIENRSLIHGLILVKQIRAAESGVEGVLSLLGGEFLVLALDVIAQGEN